MKTKDYHWDYFVLREVVRADISDVYKAWTQPSEIESWFLRSANFTDAQGQLLDKKTRIQPGMKYAWEWYGYDMVEEGRVLEANGTNKLAFTFAGECIVTIELLEEQGVTVVILTQNQIPTDEKSKVNIHLGCTKGWVFYLANLKAMLKGGGDMRVKDAGILKYLKENPVADIL